MGFEIEEDTLVRYIDEPGLFSVILPEEIKCVDRKAFDGCDIVKTVTGMNVRSIGKLWGDHEIKGARADLCLVFPEVSIDHEPAYTFKMALCLGFLRYEKLYEKTCSTYENYAIIQKKWLLKSLIRSNSDEMLLKALEFYERKKALSAGDAEDFLSYAIENDKTQSSAVLINFRHSAFSKEKAGVFDEFEL